MTDATDSNSRDRLVRIAKDAAGIFDSAVFIGDRATKGRRGAISSGMLQDQAHAFSSQEEALEFLRHNLKPNDLVLLRGRGVDHIARLYFALIGPIDCVKTHCDKQILCDLCPELGALSLESRPY